MGRCGAYIDTSSSHTALPNITIVDISLFREEQPGPTFVVEQGRSIRLKCIAMGLSEGSSLKWYKIVNKERKRGEIDS